MNGQVVMGACLRLLPSGPDGLEELTQALDRAGLPSDDVFLPVRRFFRAVDAGGPVGFGGLEGAGPDLLLRSVVVRADSRRRGHGAALVRALEGRAAASGASVCTCSRRRPRASSPRLGYAPAIWETAPAAIAATAQFASLCSASAGYLVKTLPARA